jgi:DNA-directed RNA polymerase specialized sigma24 family protein
MADDNYHLSDEFLEAQAQQRAFASSFFRRQISRYEAELGADAVRSFTRWWTSNSSYVGVSAETQREFDGAAHDVCDLWLNRWAQKKTKQIIAGETEVAPAPMDEVKILSAKWGITKGLPLPIPQPKPVQPTWSPCKHWLKRWGLSDVPEDDMPECDNCKAERILRAAGDSDKTQAMYDWYRPFVRKRLHAELLPYTKQIGQHPQFDDIEQLVWAKVMVSIDGYDPQGMPFAWLRTVVNSVVKDYFAGAYLDRRDTRKTQSLGDNPDKALDQIRVVDERGNPCLPQEKPVSPEDAGPDDETEARAYLSTLKAKSASKLGRF